MHNTGRRASRVRSLCVLFAAVTILTGAGSEEMLPVLMGLVVILVGAKLFGEVARRFGQPAVLGEIAAGIFLGNLELVGVPFFAALSENAHIEILAQLGVLLLLFEVGLESTVGQMLKTGLSSLLVAAIGVVLPMALGWFASSALLPAATWHTHLFVGATLTATSVGITARVLKDLGRSTSLEARTILGAAVIDDVLGLVVLSVVVSAIAASSTGGSLTAMDGLVTLGQAAAFLIGAIFLGLTVAPRIFSLSSRLTSPGVLFAVSLAFCFILSWGAGAIGLAPIVGAFAAGLVLEEVHFRDFGEGGQKQLEELIHPVVAFLAPVFFVGIGMKTDITTFADTTVLLLAGVLTVVGIIGKILAGFGAIGKGLDRLSIGIGMIPRGEVGLIFANMGLALGPTVLPPSLFSALIVVVMLTTVITPPLLSWSLGRRE